MAHQEELEQEKVRGEEGTTYRNGGSSVVRKRKEENDSREISTVPPATGRPKTSRKRWVKGEEKEDKKRRKKEYVSATTKAPTPRSAEIPLLSILARSPDSGIQTSVVLKELKEQWFVELTPPDLSAIFPLSKKKVVDSVLKFAKKNLALKDQVLSAGADGCPVGTWKIAERGLGRLQKEGGDSWTPRYTVSSDRLVEV